MKNDFEARCIALGEYIIETKSTVRKAAEVFGISKSTVHIDVTKRLRLISPALAEAVNEVLQENKAQRHLRGGAATKEKYFMLKNN